MMTIRSVLLVMLAVLAIGCNSSGKSNGGGTPTAPTNPTDPPVATTTITITASGVSPKRITVPAGSRVTFVNNDSGSHEMNSDPHPTHGDCPAINDIGFIQAGQTKQTGNLTTTRTCGYHDHNQPNVTALQGEIIVQ